MNVEEIKQAISKLSPEDFGQFRMWFEEFENKRANILSVEEKLTRLRGSLKGKGILKAFSEEKVYDIMDEKMIQILKGIICRLAYEGRKIIVGRSAGVILKDVPNKLNIRLEAPTEWRINRIMQIIALKNIALILANQPRSNKIIKM